MEPLAERLRPTKIEDMVGQSHIIGEGKVINKMLESGNIQNMILYGNPGTGKTTLAEIIANVTGKKYIKLNAVNCGVKEIKEAIDDAKSNGDNLFSIEESGVLLVIDEFQVLNKKQQQILLDVIEKGNVTLIALTADNPYFVIYKAILSRSVVFEFREISKEDIFNALKRSIDEVAKGYTYSSLKVEDEALEYIAQTSNGDMRSALNKLELAFNSSVNLSDGSICLTLEKTIESSGKRNTSFAEGDKYDLLSAYHKSMRGSDPDASIFYLAKLIASVSNNSMSSNEAMQLITRRLLCVASEDVGNSVPQAITIVNACVDAALKLGFPEAKLPLAQATVYLSQCPKSFGVANAINSALHDVENIETGEIPIYLRDNHYAGAKDLGRTGYKFPHDYPNNYVKQQYLPDAIKDKKYYIPGFNKNEMAYNNYWEKIKNDK